MFNMRKIHEEALFDAIKDKSDDKTADYIAHTGDGDDSTWVKSSMARLEEQFDRSAVKSIREKCQCGYGMDEKYDLVKEVFDDTTSLQEFGNDERAVAAGLSMKDNILHLEFPFCPCPMLANVEKLETDTWCQCTTVYSKVLFEKLFGCPVKVNLLRSVKMGDEKCLMSIVPETDPYFNE